MTSSLDGVVKIGNARDLNAETETRERNIVGCVSVVGPE